MNLDHTSSMLRHPDHQKAVLPEAVLPGAVRQEVPPTLEAVPPEAAAAAVLPAEAAPEDHPEAAVQRRNLLSQSKV